MLRQIITVFEPHFKERTLDSFIGIYDSYEEIEQSLRLESASIVSRKDFIANNIASDADKVYVVKNTNSILYTCYESKVKHEDS